MVQVTSATLATPATFDELVGGIARARYAIRKVLRIVDEQARTAGIDPLHHQALIQIYGTDEGPLHVTELADRLDVPAALASRLLTVLEDRRLVHRRRSTRDLRMIEVHITEDGKDLLRVISGRVSEELKIFSRRLTRNDKLAALRVLAAYVGLRLEGDVVVDPEH